MLFSAHDVLAATSVLLIVSGVLTIGVLWVPSLRRTRDDGGDVAEPQWAPLDPQSIEERLRIAQSVLAAQQPVTIDPPDLGVPVIRSESDGYAADALALSAPTGSLPEPEPLPAFIDQGPPELLHPPVAVVPTDPPVTAVFFDGERERGGREGQGHRYAADGDDYEEDSAGGDRSEAVIGLGATPRLDLPAWSELDVSGGDVRALWPNLVPLPHPPTSPIPPSLPEQRVGDPESVGPDTGLGWDLPPGGDAAVGTADTAGSGDNMVDGDRGAGGLVVDLSRLGDDPERGRWDRWKARREAKREVKAAARATKRQTKAERKQRRTTVDDPPPLVVTATEAPAIASWGEHENVSDVVGLSAVNSVLAADDTHFDHSPPPLAHDSTHPSTNPVTDPAALPAMWSSPTGPSEDGGEGTVLAFDASSLDDPATAAGVDPDGARSLIGTWDSSDVGGGDGTHDSTLVSDPDDLADDSGWELTGPHSPDTADVELVQPWDGPVVTDTEPAVPKKQKWRLWSRSAPVVGDDAAGEGTFKEGFQLGLLDGEELEIDGFVDLWAAPTPIETFGEVPAEQDLLDEAELMGPSSIQTVDDAAALYNGTDIPMGVIDVAGLSRGERRKLEKAAKQAGVSFEEFLGIGESDDPVELIEWHTPDDIQPVFSPAEDIDYTAYGLPEPIPDRSAAQVDPDAIEEDKASLAPISGLASSKWVTINQRGGDHSRNDQGEEPIP